ncbi:MAG: exosortase T [Myxococcales bacterium]|nr:exosortase T [Myxococcales bacterium]MCB9530373.1 exosortase T [Myxococcales bacterium]
MYRAPAILLAIAAAVLVYHPAVWLVGTWTSDAYDSAGGAVFCVVVALVAWSLSSGRTTEDPSAARRARAILVATAAVRALGELLAVDVVGGAALALDVHALGLLLRLDRRPVSLAPGCLALLFALTLPVERIAQRLAGYPLQWASARGACALLRTTTDDLVCQGVRISLDGADVLVDLPCSGTRGLFVVAAVLLTLATTRRPAPKMFTAGVGLAALSALIANALRIAALALGIAHGGPSFLPGGAAHEAVGVVALALATVPLVAWSRFVTPRHTFPRHTFPKVVDRTPDAFPDAFPKVVDSARCKAADTFPKVVDRAAEDTLPKVMDRAAEPLLDSAADTFPKVVDSAAEDTFPKVVDSAAKPLLNSAADAFPKVVDSLTDTFPKVVDSAAGTFPKVVAGPRLRAWRSTALGVLALSGAMGVTLVPAHPLDVSRPFPSLALPRSIAGAEAQPDPLSAREEAVYAAHGGSALRARYGSHAVLAVRTSSPLRHLHEPEECLSALGADVHRLGVVFEPVPSAVYRVRAPDQREYRVAVTFVGSDGAVATSVAEVVWRWLRSPDTEWTGIQRIAPWDLASAEGRLVDLELARTFDLPFREP